MVPELDMLAVHDMPQQHHGNMAWGRFLFNVRPPKFGTTRSGLRAGNARPLDRPHDPLIEPLERTPASDHARVRKRRTRTQAPHARATRPPPARAEARRTPAPHTRHARTCVARARACALPRARRPGKRALPARPRAHTGACPRTPSALARLRAPARRPLRPCRRPTRARRPPTSARVHTACRPHARTHARAPSHPRLDALRAAAVDHLSLAPPCPFTKTPSI